MILASISLQNFRSYSRRTIEFFPGTTLIVGPNGAGKTNIIEAIFMMAAGKSFRAESDREVISWESELSAISCQLSSDTKLQMMITQGEVAGRKVPLKKYFVNKVPRRQIDFVGNLRVALFWPQDMELVTDSPSMRRRYLDSVLVQIDREYRRNLYSYEKGLRQRNRLLDLINEGTATRSQLLFWNQLLIKAGGYITDRRGEYIEYVNEYRVSSIEYRVEYDKSVISESRLEQYKDEEVAAKTTLVGPQRDDFIINTQSKNQYKELSKYGSRGEQRMAVLWLKLAELSFIQEKTGERPVLLLDDIFSELDARHRDLIFDLITSQQTIMTTADPEEIPGHHRAGMSIIQL